MKCTVLVILIAVLAGCSMQGVRHFELVDPEGSAINDVTVVPLYSVNIGVGVGPDGKGPHSYSYVITGPFTFDSGEDIIAKHPKSTQVLIPVPPFAAAGKGYRGIRWLLLKQGYAVKLVDEKLMYSYRPVQLSRSNNPDHDSVINTLMSRPVSQSRIKTLFNIQWVKEEVQVSLSEKDRNLLMRLGGPTTTQAPDS